MFPGRTQRMFLAAFALVVFTARATELKFSTYLGGTGDAGLEAALGVAVDGASNVFVTGVTAADAFPTVNAYQAVRRGGTDAFIVKFDPTGSNLLFATLFGGATNDVAHAVALDAAGNIYICGETSSTNLPVTNPVQATLRGGTDAFVAKFDPTGTNLLFATYLGGTGNDVAFALAVDPSGSNVHLAGFTRSANFPVTNAVQTTLRGESDAFVATLSTLSSNLVRATYLGGTANEDATGIARGSDGSLFVTGQTDSFNFPRAAALHNALNLGVALAGFTDAFVARLAPTGTNLIFSTFLGGRYDDSANALALDTADNVYLTGRTHSHDFPRVNALQRLLNRDGVPTTITDAFVAKLHATGSNLLFSTFLGGRRSDSGNSIAVDETGAAHVVGRSLSADFPRVNALQVGCRGCDTLTLLDDAFLVKFSPTGTNLTYATLLGGGAADVAYAVAVNGDAFLAGYTTSANFPRARPQQLTRRGTADAFLTRVADAVPYDLAVTAITPRRRIRIPAGGSLTSRVSVTIQNRGPQPVVIPDAATLATLVTLNVESLDACAAPVALLLTNRPQRLLPVTLPAKRTLRVYYDVVFGCVNDPLATARGFFHDDYRFTASVDHSALPGGIPDSHPDDDTCPRTVEPPYEIDPYPDGTILDRGCGARLPAGVRGGDVLADLVVVP